MWGDQAIGKLVRGDDALKPVAEAFVDEDAGPEVMQKVQRRLQHFIDRRIVAQFEPLLALARDEAITGLARGVAFRLLENFGIVARAEIGDDIKALDQEARWQLRKHGVRFGQFTIFQPLLLKPAPTRLRLVLWGLSQGLDMFPESPPPGLVTIPHDGQQPQGYYTMSGYRPAGQRAIRIDMLERLADMLRNKDTRGGFEASADMLSITGLTLDQFADLMAGLGYRGERGERPKVKAMAVAVVVEGDPTETPTEIPGETPAETPVEHPVETPADPPVEQPIEHPDEAPPAAPEELPADLPLQEAVATELEVFYTFTWAPRRQGNGPRPQRRNDGAKPRAEGAKPRKEGGKPRFEGNGKPRGKGGKPPRSKGDKPPREDKQTSFSARPEKRDRIDPDNPFAQALAGLKGKS